MVCTGVQLIMYLYQRSCLAVVRLVHEMQHHLVPDWLVLYLGRRGFAQANIKPKEAEPPASASWAARLLNRGSKPGSEGPAASVGKDAAKGAADAGAKGATLVKAKGSASRNIDVLQTRKNMASVISPGLIAEPFRRRPGLLYNAAFPVRQAACSLKS